MALKRFATGVQDLAIFREDGKYYVDKTDLVHKMVKADRYWFLSRPRRFGKSLLVSVLKYYFEGRRDLFGGMAISRLETEWKPHPVVSLSFAGSCDSVRDLRDKLHKALSNYEKQYGLPVPDSAAWGVRLQTIIETAREKTGRGVVLLIDEYDAPLVNSLDKPALLESLRSELNRIYAPVKDLSPLLRFFFLTGVSRFSQLSIFSALNNLNDITLDDDYAAICGITKEELLSQLRPEIQALAEANSLSFGEACAALARKYDGYHFSENSPDVYNPFSLLNALAKRKLSNFWFETGTPTILTRLIRRRNVSPIAMDTEFRTSAERFTALIEKADDVVPLLYQAGYLTIKKFRNGVYTLAFPNEEVAIGFLDSLLPHYAKSPCENDSFIIGLADDMADFNPGAALAKMKAFMSSIPYNAEKQTEDHYKTVFYLVFRLLSKFNVRTEVCTAAGRADVVVETDGAVYVFEFKLDSSSTPRQALEQIDSKGYLIPYTASPGKKLFKIGVSFDTSLRTLGDWIVSAAESGGA